MPESGSKAHAPTDLREFFDDYVNRVFPQRRNDAAADWTWPGDEWVSDTTREETFKLIVEGLDPKTLSEVIEIGPGAGKYTELFLARTPARLHTYELSGAFNDILKSRFETEIECGRLTPIEINWTDNEGLIRNYQSDMPADLFFSIDALYFMDFQSLLVYFISAACVLKQSGRFFATLADGTSESGWERMIRDVGRHSAFDASPCTRFYWLDIEMLEFVLPRLGFGNIRVSRGPDGGLDIARLYVSAELLDSTSGLKFREALKPVNDSTNVVKNL